jgi:hypothetical protein
VGKVIAILGQGREKTCDILVQDETVTQCPILTTFEHHLFQQYQECCQGARTVQVYVDDFYRLSARNDLMETEAQLVAWFIGGLHLPIQDKVSMQHVFTLTEAVSLATRTEKQLE